MAQQNLGWVHGDIKSDNVIVVKNQNNTFSGKLIDLGWAKKIKELPSKPIFHFKQEKNMLALNEILYPHMAPEKLLNLVGCSLETEVWALGCLLSDVGLTYNIESLVAYSRKCMQREPVKRPSMETVFEIIKDLAKTEVMFC